VIAEWTEEVAPPGPPRLIPPLHAHRSDDEAWYVLEGVLTVRMGEDEVIVPAGSALLVPKGIEHTFWNAGAKPVRYLLIMTQRIYRLIGAIHSTTDRSPSAMADLFENYDSVLNLARF
jgi:mannose-6-phosphate isomerase-like protein (cupin superfamily)